MDKHTKRYMYERFQICYENLDVYTLANALNQSEPEDDFIYLSHAVKDLEDETERKVLKEKMLKKQFGWD